MVVCSWEVVRPDSETFERLSARTGRRFGTWMASWDACPPAERDPLTHPVWLLAWLTHRGRHAGDAVRLLLLHRGEAPVEPDVLAGLPCALRRAPWPFGRSRCRVVHEDDYTLEAASLGVAAVHLRPALEALERTELDGFGRLAELRLGKVDQGHPLVGSGLAAERFRAGSRSVIRIDASGWDGVHARLSRNFRGNLRKSRNRLDSERPILECHTDRDGLWRGLDRLSELEARSWKGRIGSTIGGNPAMRAFLRDALEGFAARGEAVIHILRAAERDVAAQLSLVLDGVLHVLKIGYDEDRARLSPGNLLLERCIRCWCPERGIREINLVTDQDWHAKWRPERRDTFELRVYPRDAAGAWTRWAGVPLRRRVKRRLERRAGDAEEARGR